MLIIIWIFYMSIKFRDFFYSLEKCEFQGPAKTSQVYKNTVDWE